MTVAALEEVRRKALARFETPPALADFLWDQVARRLGPAAGEAVPGSRQPLCVVDPTCGSGALLVAATPTRGYGVDLDPGAAATAARRIGTVLGGRVKAGNALLDPLPFPLRPAFVTERRELLSRLADLRASGEYEAAERLTEPLRRRLSDRLPLELRDRQPFCWALEFPEIALAGGFDAVITNPPWDKLKLLERECFAPELRELHESEQRRIRARLAGEAAVRTALATEKRALAAFRVHLRESRPVPAALAGDANAYLAVLDMADGLLRASGALGAIVPGGFWADLSARAWRDRLFATYQAVATWGFEPRTDAFPDIDQRAAVFAARKAGTGPGGPVIEVRAGLRSLAELAAGAAVPVGIALIRRSAPESAAIPPLAHPADAAIVEKLYAVGPAFGTGPWQPRFGRELDMTTDADVFDQVPAGAPLWEGKRLGAFEICPVDAVASGAWPACRQGCGRAASCPYRRKNGQQLWVEESRLGARDKGHAAHSRIAWRTVARADRQRRLEAALVPAGYRLGNSLNYLVGDKHSQQEKLTLLAYLNSLVVEWRFRHLSANNNVNLFAIRQLPVPPGVAPGLVELAGALTDARPGAGPPRGPLRLMLEARVARCFVLSRDELARILAAFPKLPAADAGAILSHFDRSRST
ncbi:MAG: hypothetical protein FJZ01_16910 [Candidatus Sericytochromatia bacterium]|nr:hypothetical protein [Candidatus Tanganyikabacteria bacterium]